MKPVIARIVKSMVGEFETGQPFLRPLARRRRRALEDRLEVLAELDPLPWYDDRTPWP
jgi:hypothetical protein